MSSASRSRRGGGLQRLVADLRALDGAHQLCGALAVVLVVTMVLPWYSEQTNAVASGALASHSSATPAITVFSFVEAAIFLVAAAVVALVVARARGAAFHLPGGDGTIVAVAGGWATFLVFFRFVDQPSGQTSRFISTTYGLSWGIFFGLLAAAALLYSGIRLRSAHVAEPPLHPGRGARTAAPPPPPEGGPDAGTTDAPTASTAVVVPGARAAARAERLAAQGRERPAPDAAQTVVDRRERRPAPAAEAEPPADPQ